MSAPTVEKLARDRIRQSYCNAPQGVKADCNVDIAICHGCLKGAAIPRGDKLCAPCRACAFCGERRESRQDVYCSGCRFLFVFLPPRQRTAPVIERISATEARTYAA